jgi:preprotein translocase subunit SecD
MRRPWSTLVFIIILIMLAVAVVRPNGRLQFYNFAKHYNFSQGLDLQGGIHLKYTLDLGRVDDKSRPEAIKGVKNVIENRINPLGIAEPVVQISKVGNDAALIVELPGQKDVQSAVDSIGKTAKLTFRKLDPTTGTFAETNLTGADLKPNGVSVVQNPTTHAPQINLNFTGDGTKKFSDLTKELVGQSLAIYLDDSPLQIATVQEQISGGQAQISGQFTIKEAQDTVRLLNAGALPVPLKLVEQRTIGATLGQESIERSLVAGLIGLLLVAIFMILYYRILGVVAVIALLLYTAISLAIFKILPVTLTLAGITGFILSIGMAVDANILIFERFKEEQHAGKSLRRAIHDGFERAWSSIRDSNVSSIITALILYNFASSSLIKGFSLTLMIGILVSLFTAVTVSRSLLYLIMGTRLLPGAGDEAAEKKVGEPRPEKLQLGRSSRW